MSSNTRSYLSRASLGNKAAASGACGRRTGRRRLLRSRARQARGARPAAAAPFTRAHPACGARTAAALHRRVWPRAPGLRGPAGGGFAPGRRGRSCARVAASDRRGHGQRRGPRPRGASRVKHPLPRLAGPGGAAACAPVLRDRRRRDLWNRAIDCWVSGKV